MVPLRMGIGEMGPADALDPVKQGHIGVNGPAQVGPVRPLSASDHVVDGRKGIALVIEMTVLHLLSGESPTSASDGIGLGKSILVP